MPPIVDLLGLVEEIEVAARSIHVNPIGAARIVVTADVHVAEASNPLMVELLEHLCAVLAHEDVVMPGVAVGMHEDGGVGEVVVVVDEVGQINLNELISIPESWSRARSTYHGLSTLVLGDFVDSIWIVDFIHHQRRIR